MHAVSTNQIADILHSNDKNINLRLKKQDLEKTLKTQQHFAMNSVKH